MKYLILLFSFFVATVPAWDGRPLEGGLSDKEEGSEPAAAPTPAVTLKPGETAKVTKKTITTIKITTDSGSPLDGAKAGPEHSNTSAERPSWRCKNIPDDAFTQLGTYSKKAQKAEWEERATEFVASNAEKCPSYEALEKELPPQLGQKKYTEMLKVMFDLNKVVRSAGLIPIARDDEVTEHRLSLERKSAKKRANQTFLEAFNEEHMRLRKRARAAQLLLALKFADESKGRLEANRFVDKFGSDFLDRKGGIKTENFPSLKAMLKSLSPQLRMSVKLYVKDILGYREYPKTNLLPIDTDRGKSNRDPASLSKKEAGNRTVLQLLLFELE